MRELTTVETEQAGGGIIGQVLTFVGGVIGSYVGSYAYEKSGGAAGIEEALSNAWDAYVDSAAAQQELCQETGLGCGYNMM